MSTDLVATRAPLRMPDALARRLTERHRVDPARCVEVPSARPHRAVRRWRAGDLLVEAATHADGARRLRLEVVGRRWAEHHGIPTPAVLDADPDGGWVVGAWLADPVRSGPVYVAHCVAVAAQISRATDLPPDAHRATSWRGPRRTVAVRALRTVGGGMSPWLWRAARRQVAELPHPVEVAHGDFYPDNVLGVPDGGVQVVDWEYVGRAPRHTDLARMWSVLADIEDREQVLAEMLRGSDRAERRRVGALLLWHALRLCGENLSAPRRERNAQTLHHARGVVAEARDLAHELGAWPR